MVFENFTTIMWVVLVAGALLIIASINKNGKSKKQGQTFMIVGIALIGALFLFPNFFTNLSVQTQAIGSPAVVTPGTGVCLQTTATTVTLSAQDKFTGASAGGTHAYKIGNSAVATVSDGGTFSASPGTSISVLYENGSTSSSYFSNKLDFVVPCKPTYDPSEDHSEPLLVQNSSLTFSVFNEDGLKIDGTTNNETINAGESSTMEVKLNAQSQKGFPHGGIFYLEHNATDFDISKTTFSLGGITLRRLGSVPGILKPSNTANSFVVWETTDPIEGSALISGSVHLETKTSSTNPGNTNDPVLGFRPYNYYRDTNSANIFSGPGVSDSTDSATYGHVTTTTIQLN